MDDEKDEVVVRTYIPEHIQYKQTIEVIKEAQEMYGIGGEKENDEVYHLITTFKRALELLNEKIKVLQFNSNLHNPDDLN